MVKVAVVIDVFRAFTTAAYILERQPRTYCLMKKQQVVSELALHYSNSILIGKSEKGAEQIAYHIPNSPTRVMQTPITGQHILHRTEAGALGVLQSKGADIILAVGFVNAKATIDYIKELTQAQVTVLPMGHEGITPSMEDEACAHYVKELMKGRSMDLTSLLHSLKEGPGQYFFKGDQWQYPAEDFERCLEMDRFSFAIQAEIKEGEYALLTRCD